MRVSSSAAAITVAALMAYSPAQAQERWAVEVRGGAAVPTGNVADDDWTTGVGFDGTVSYRFMPHLGAYAGWDWVHFGPDASFAGAGVDFEETGYAFGLRFEHPFSGETAGPAYWLRVGGTYDHLELEDSGGDGIADSGHGLGWEAGLGIALDVGALRLTPGARFRSLSRDVTVAGATTQVDLRYVMLEIGAAFTF